MHLFFFLIIILFLAGSYLDFKICFCPFSFFLSSSSPVFFLIFFFFYVQTRLANQCLLRFLQIYFAFNKTGYSPCCLAFTYINYEHIIFSNSFGSDWNIANHERTSGTTSLSGNQITQRSLCKELQNNSSMSLRKDCLEREMWLFELHSVMLASNESA